MAAEYKVRRPTARKRKMEAMYYAGVSDAKAAGALDAVERKVEAKYPVPALNIARRGLAGAELKAFDMSGDKDNLPDDPTGSEVNDGFLCAPVLGNAIDERSGNKVTLKGIVVDCVVSSGADVNANTMRGPLHIWTALVMDKQTNCTAINGEDVYDHTVTPHTRRVLENAARFRVLGLHKSVLPVAIQTGTAGNNNVCTTWGSDKFTFSKRLNQQCNFIQAAGGGTTADIKDHSLSLLCWGEMVLGNVSQALPASANISFVSRVRYTDP